MANSMADLLKELGDIPPERVRIRPVPGTATVQNIVDIDAHEDRLFELVDGVLVAKQSSLRESIVAIELNALLHSFVIRGNLGIVVGSAMMEILPGLVRIPGVAFLSWARLPGGKVPTDAVPNIVPDLAIEILSKGNTVAEMNRKRREYFKAGVILTWIVDHKTRTLKVYTSPEDFREFTENETVCGDPVLPGFTLSLRELFSELDRRA